MPTKKEISDLADKLIRDKGYNGFSFKDISNAIGIKTSSIHYHFSFKSDLGVYVIKEQIKHFEMLKKGSANKDPKKKLEVFFKIYTQIKEDNKVCLVGSLATDFNTIEDNVKAALKQLAEQVLAWVTEILEEGRSKKVFYFEAQPRTKAMMIISNMLAMVQLTRLTKEDDLEKVKKQIIKELTHK